MLKPRPVREDDVPGILALIADVYAEYGLTLRAELEEQHLLSPGEYFRGHGGEFWVVEEAGRIVATCGVKLHRDAGELKTLYVQRSLRGQGWGRRLTELATDFARRAGRPKMILWSDTRFENAHRLYHSLGFVQAGERDLGDSNDSREYGFHKPLACD